MQLKILTNKNLKQKEEFEYNITLKLRFYKKKKK